MTATLVRQATYIVDRCRQKPVGTLTSGHEITEQTLDEAVSGTIAFTYSDRSRRRRIRITRRTVRS